MPSTSHWAEDASSSGKANPQYLFVSYHNDDRDRVLPIVNAVRKELEVRALPIQVWIDLWNLQPGENFQSAILKALKSSVGFLFFVSPRSIQSTRDREELMFAIANPDRLIIPVFLHRDLKGAPRELVRRQGIYFAGRTTDEQIMSAASAIADAVESRLKSTRAQLPAVAEEKAPIIAAELARELRSRSERIEGGDPKSVFVVHGHSSKALAELEHFLKGVDVEPILLSRRGESAQSLFQKFMAVASKARFAVVLLSSDDYGASRRQYDTEGVGQRALQFRARQNVLLELGFFYGRLGWEQVFVVYEDPDKVFPNFERPSDLDGVVFDSMSHAAWQTNLRVRLTQAGFAMPSSA